MNDVSDVTDVTDMSERPGDDLDNLDLLLDEADVDEFERTAHEEVVAAEEDSKTDAPGSSGGGNSPSAVAAATFWTSGGGVGALGDPTPFGNENALQKLGKPPFEKSVRSKFRLLGFLATVYEHVSADVATGRNPQHQA